MSSNIVAAKRDLRRQAIARRDAMGVKPGVAEQLIAHFPALDLLSGKAVVSGFWPIGSEIDPRPLMIHLAASGHRLALPVVTGKGKPLVFREWEPGDAMAEAQWGIPEPMQSAAEVQPDLVLVPLLAFDRAGYRLGYGGGYYDRSLALLRAACGTLAVGLAFAEQEVQHVPRGPHDQRLDWMLTDKACLAVQTANRGLDSAR